MLKAPLYMVRLDDDSTVYWFTEKEHDENINKYNNIKHIERIKGLGQMSKQVMHDTAMCPDTRKIIKIEVKDIEKMNEAFDIWMNTDVEKRKNLIEKELCNYVFED